MGPVNDDTMMHLLKIYHGSDGAATQALYEQLTAHGPRGIVAVNLFRASKTSARAKLYRRGVHKRSAYDRKAWSITNLASALHEHASAVGIEQWGWGKDPRTIGFPWVFYAELPTGQVSYHTESRGVGPDFGKQWDGSKGEGPARICRWVATWWEAR